MINVQGPFIAEGLESPHLKVGNWGSWSLPCTLDASGALENLP